MTKKNNLSFLKYGSFLFTAFIGIVCVECFLLPIYIYSGNVVFLIGVLAFPTFTSLSIVISRVFFTVVEVNNTGIIWRLFGKVVHKVEWMEIKNITIMPKMMNISIVLQISKSDEVLYFNGGKSRLNKVLSYCDDEKLKGVFFDF